jgi:uncharacterized protein (TIGR02266 family)
MAQERRKHPRYPVKMPVSVTSGSRTLAVLVKDISREAVFVNAEEPFPEGAEVTVTFGLPGKDGPLKVPGRVVRAAREGGEGGPGMAILFRELTPAAQVRLDFFIALQAG